MPTTTAYTKLMLKISATKSLRDLRALKPSINKMSGSEATDLWRLYDHREEILTALGRSKKP